VTDTLIKQKLISREQVTKDKGNTYLQKDLLLLAMAATTLYSQARAALKESKQYKYFFLYCISHY